MPLYAYQRERPGCDTGLVAAMAEGEAISYRRASEEAAMKGRFTKSGESWDDLNKRRGRLAAEARKSMAAFRREYAREQRAKTLSAGAADVRITQALGSGFHLHIARTVLTALIEPTPGMVEAARGYIDDGNKWRAMVKVALLELGGIYRHSQ